MEKLTKAEEPIMHWLWKCKKAFVKEIIEKLPDPKPPYNTVSSIIRVLVDKGMVGYESFGRTHRYFAILSKNEYRAWLFKSVISDYFDGSYSSIVSHIVDNEKLSDNDMEEIKNLINNKIEP